MEPSPAATLDSAPRPDVAPGRSGARTAGRVPLALVVLLTVLHLAAMGGGPGRGLGDDYAQYVLHARNLVEGRPYAETGYIFNPLDPWFSPRTYPPGFPLLLAPVYAALGPDFRAMKVLVVLALGGTLLLVARLARRDLRPATVYAAVVLVGLHPFLWEFRENVLPDIPFTFFCLLALVQIGRAEASGLAARGRAGRAALAIPAMAMAAATRTIGVVLVPTLLAVLVMRSRRRRRAALLCAGAGVVLLAALALAPRGSGYLRQLGDLAASGGAASLLPDLEHVRWTGFALTEVWSGGGSPWTGRAAALAAALLAGVGIAPRLRRPGAPELFLAFYLGAVFLWPAAQPRYFVPVIPLWVLYAAAGAERLARAGRPAARAAVALAALAVAAPYAERLASWERPGDTGAGVSARAAEMYRHVRAHTPPEARFVADNPRAFALFTGRAAAPASRRGSDADALLFMEGAGIGYVALRAGPDRSRGLVERNPDRFARVHAGTGYELHRLVPRGKAAE